MSYLWDKTGVPHFGWTCVSVIDLNPDQDPELFDTYETCQMCGHEQIRFVHTMEHEEFDGTLDVGCICAVKMSGDSVGPKQREIALRNKAGRRAKWLKRKWRRSYNGNDYLNIKGFNIVIYPDKYHEEMWRYRITNRSTNESVFGRINYSDRDEAKLALFDDFEQLCRE